MEVLGLVPCQSDAQYIQQKLLEIMEKQQVAAPEPTIFNKASDCRKNRMQLARGNSAAQESVDGL
jgi:hypothetical protein